MMSAEKPNQNRNKLILAGVLGLIVLCFATCAAGYFVFQRSILNTFKIDPAQAKDLARQITDYDLPVGYQEAMGSSTFGITMATLSDKNADNMIWLVQTQANRLPDAESFLSSGMKYEQNNPITWKSADVKVFTIRGEKSSITQYDGTAKDGKQYHSWAGKFKAKGGSGLLVIVGPDETWDETAAEAFIRSMR